MFSDPTSVILELTDFVDEYPFAFENSLLEIEGVESVFVGRILGKDQNHMVREINLEVDYLFQMG